MTRARKKLTLTLARCRSLFGELRFNQPSRFVRELSPDLTEGLGALERLAERPQWGAQKTDDDFDQRPRYPGDPPTMRNKMRFSRDEPASKPPMKEAAPGVDGVGSGSRVRHPTFGVGTVEGVDGVGPARKLEVRFGPGVGLKRVLARFVDKA